MRCGVFLFILRRSLCWRCLTLFSYANFFFFGSVSFFLRSLIDFVSIYFHFHLCARCSLKSSQYVCLIENFQHFEASIYMHAHCVNAVNVWLYRFRYTNKNCNSINRFFFSYKLRTRIALFWICAYSFNRKYFIFHMIYEI